MPREGYQLKWPLTTLFLFIIYAFFTRLGISQDVSAEVNLERIKVSCVDTIVYSDTAFVRNEVVYFNNDSLGKHLYLKIHADEIVSEVSDTVYIIQQKILIKSDTVFSVNDIVFGKLYKYSKRKNLLAGLLRGLISYKPNSHKPSLANDQSIESTNPYLKFEGKTIKSIHVMVMEPFGSSIDNPERTASSALEKGGNFLHVKSRKKLIKNFLLFDVGDKINPLEFAETERIIRSNDFIYDARVIVLDSIGLDSVDVLVVAQDIFSLGVGAAADFRNHNYNISFRELNLAGLGQMLWYDLKIGSIYSGNTNHLIQYRVNNIYQSFVSTNAYVNLQNGFADYGLKVNRDFVTPSMKWIGGMNYEYFTFPYRNGLEILPQHENDSISFFRQDYWLGVPTGLFISNSNYFNGKRVLFSARYFKTSYLKRPPERKYIDSNFRYPYYSSDFVLGNISLYQRKNYKDNYIFRFGRTEDIPDGILISGLTGLHFTERSTRPYFGLNYFFSKYNLSREYLFLNIGVGGFLNKKAVEDGVFNIRSLFFSPLLPIKRTKIRQFLGFRYTYGHNMSYGNTIDINNEKGLRGFSSLSVVGNKKFILNYESNIFLPYNLLGFKFAFLVFSDLAWISTSQNLFNKNNFFPAFGIGFKIRNIHLNLDSIQFYLGYYPNNNQANARDFLIFQRSYSFYTFNNFYFSRPDVVPYY